MAKVWLRILRFVFFASARTAAARASVHVLFLVAEDSQDFANVRAAAAGRDAVLTKVSTQSSPVEPGLWGRNGEVLAEPRAVCLIKGAGFEVEETHFGPGGRKVFECLSLFDFKGWKIDEKGIQGQKQEEYFALWSSDH